MRPVPVFGPVYEQASERHPDAVFGKVDTEAQPEVAATFNITSIPTLMIVRDNIVLYSQPGALPQAALEQLITKAAELDMDEVPGQPSRAVRRLGPPRPRRARGGGNCAGRWPGTARRTRPSPGR